MSKQYILYIIRLLVGPLLIITASLTAIIWLTRALRFVDFIVNRGLSLGDFLHITALLLPSLLLILLPVALFIAVIVTYNRLHIESELVVLKSSGLSRLQLSQPALVVSVGVMIVCYAISLFVLPLANRSFNDMRTFIRDNYASVLLQEEVFNNPVDGLTVFIRERDDEGNLKGILVHDNRLGQDPVTMMAEQGKLLSTPEGPRFFLVKGQRQERKDGRVSWLNFDEYMLDISFYTGMVSDRKLDPDEEFVHDLFRDPQGGKYTLTDKAQRYAEAHRRLSWPLFCVGGTVLALGVLLSGGYSRRGQWKRIAMASLAITGVLMLSVTASNIMVDYPSAFVFLYLLPLLSFVCGIILLSHRFLPRCPELPQQVEAK